MHQHYDPDDNLTGYTIITRESPWDDESRRRALALAEYENSICQCGCGLPVDVAFDDAQAFKVDTIVCRAGKAKAQVERKTREAHEKDPNGAWSDGLYHYVVPVDDDRPAEKRRGARGD